MYSWIKYILNILAVSRLNSSIRKIDPSMLSGKLSLICNEHIYRCVPIHILHLLNHFKCVPIHIRTAFTESFYRYI